MFKWLKQKLSGLFVNEIRVQRPGSQSIDVPLNRRQRRVKAALQRKQAQRNKNAVIPRPEDK